MGHTVMNADYNGATTPRGPSNGLWHNPALPCPWNRIQDEMIGIWINDDFTEIDTTDVYVATQAATGTAVLDDAVGGVLLLDCNSATATQGIQLQRAGSATTGELFLPAAGKHIWCEARVKVADMTAGTTGPEFFFGLATIDTTVIGTSANSTDNHIGFESITDDGVLLGYGEKATVRTTGVTTHSLVDDTWVKLGFTVEGVSTITFYVNGVACATTLDDTYIPLTAMVPTFVCQSDGTVDSILHVDWLRVAQLTDTNP